MKYLSILSFFYLLVSIIFMCQIMCQALSPHDFFIISFSVYNSHLVFTHNWVNFFFLLERHQNDVKNLTLLNKGEILKSKKYIVILHFTYKCKIPQIIHGSSCKAIFRFGFLSNNYTYHIVRQDSYFTYFHCSTMIGTRNELRSE